MNLRRHTTLVHQYAWKGEIFNKTAIFDRTDTDKICDVEMDYLVNQRDKITTAD